MPSQRPVRAGVLAGFIGLSSGAGAAGPIGPPAAGHHGFDWLQPQRARCERLTQAQIDRLPRCTPESGVFGLSIPAQRCRVGARSEYLVFVQRAQCVEALETMKANAP